MVGFATHVYSCISFRRLKIATLCYANKSVTEGTDDVSEVLIEDSIDMNLAIIFLISYMEGFIIVIDPI